MKSIQIYDPPMCCSTGVCGTNIEPDLVSFATLLSHLAQRGTQIKRYNLGKEPIAFVENQAVKALLESDGADALPFIFWDDELKLKGRYPTKDERQDWNRAAHEDQEAAP